MSAAYLDPKVAKEIFGPVDGILAWGPPGAPFEAEPVPGGYCISGTWRFASGSQNATWLGAHMKVAGSREVRTMLFPKSSATMVDIWHTLGLRGTASNEYVVKDLFVPADHTMLRDQAIDRRADGPLYRFSSNQLYSAGFAGVGLGIARGLIDAFLGSARHQDVARRRPSRCARITSSSRNWHNRKQDGTRPGPSCTTRWTRLYEYVIRHGEMTDRQAAMMRLASTWSIQQSRDVVHTLYHCAGIDRDLRGPAVRAAAARHQFGVAASPGPPAALRIGRADHARPAAGKPILKGGTKMPAQSLNHYTIKVRDLERTKDFYQDIVGLKAGERPPLPFPGYWLYCGDVPTVHLIGYRAEDPVIADGPSYPAADRPTGSHRILLRRD